MINGDEKDIQWVSLREAMPGQLRARPGPKQLRNLALVLSARDIPYRNFPEKHPIDILVPRASIDIACHEIDLYLQENSRNVPAGHELVPADNIKISISVLLLLGIFHNLTYFQITGFGYNSIDWLRLGSADNTQIMTGQWWRAITALTLHADGQHLMGNILIGGYFVVRLCQWTGTGLGWALILLSGITGNLLNALVQNSGHNAVGASTAVFGAIGIAGVLGTVKSHKRQIRHWFLPLAAAGILLAFLGAGSSESNTDIGAHLFGFLCGAVSGIPAGIYLDKRGFPGRLLNYTLAAISTLTVAAAWALALSR